jgi:hypothetical protein
MRWEETSTQKPDNRKNTFVIVCRHGVPITSPRTRDKGFECKATSRQSLDQTSQLRPHRAKPIASPLNDAGESCMLQRSTPNS